MEWKQRKIRYGFLETATAGGTLTLTVSSVEYQIFTGTMAHNLVLPDATTLVNGIAFQIINESTGAITVKLNDNSTFITVDGGNSAKVILTDKSTSNGVWSTKIGVAGSAGGVGSVVPGSVKTSNYTIVGSDDGSIVLVDTSNSALTITLPAPSDGFKVTIKDIGGNASVNAITVARNGSELIDFAASDVTIIDNGAAVSFISDGTDWSRLDGFYRQNIPTSGRGLFSGGDSNLGSTPSNVIDYVTISTEGNAADFGDLSSAKIDVASCSSSTRGIVAGGAGNVTPSNVIDYVQIATLGNAVDFGDLTVARNAPAGCSNQTRGLFGGGYNGGYRNEIDYVQIATLGNAVDFGDLAATRGYKGALASSTRGVFAGGNDGVTTNQTAIDYVTIATASNSSSFGILTALGRSGLAGCANATRGIFGGGDQNNGTTLAIMDYITIASTGNAASFGNLTAAREELAACASHLRGLFAGGYTSSGPAMSNVIDWVTIATLSDATDFGDLSVTRFGLSGCSSSHGGLYV